MPIDETPFDIGVFCEIYKTFKETSLKDKAQSYNTHIQMLISEINRLQAVNTKLKAEAQDTMRLKKLEQALVDSGYLSCLVPTA